MKWRVALAMLGVLTAAPAVRATPPEPPTVWQQAQRAAFNVNPSKERLAGLDLMVDVDPGSKWPRLLRHITPCTARHADPAIHEPDAASKFRPISLGEIHVEGGQPRVASCGRTWCRGELAIATGEQALGDAPALTITTSRLSPGVLISGGKQVTLFAGEGLVGFEGSSGAVRIEVTAEAKPGITASGDATPAWFAAPGENGIVIKPAASVGELPLTQLDRQWMLVWYGKRTFFKGLSTSIYTERTVEKELYPADSPMLILLSRAPVSVSAGKGKGLSIDFGGQEGQIVVLPVLGERLPKAEETEKWKDGLPAEIVERCNWWAGHMRGFPSDVAENCRYDAGIDTVIISEYLALTPFRSFGATAAPIPPMIATASVEGFPVEFSARPEDPKLVTSLGSYLAIPDTLSYEMRFKGLGRYVAQRPSPASVVPEALRTEIVDQVRKILDAGHLAPWFRVRKLGDGWNYGFFSLTSHLVHANPGEVLYFLASAMPFLPAQMQPQVRAYLKRERKEYPPEKINLLLGGQGARREGYALTEAFLADKPQDKSFNNINYDRTKNFFISQKLIPPISMYYLAAYYGAVGTEGLAQEWPDIQAIRLPYLRQMDWASGSVHRWPNLYTLTTYQRWTSWRCNDPWYGNGGVVDTNQAFSAAIGQIRLARIAKDLSAEQLGWGLLARTAALRYALGKMPGYFYRQGLLTLAPGQRDAEQDIRTAFFVDEFGVTVRLWIYDDNGLAMLRDMTPELGLFVKDHLANEATRYYDAFTTGVPTWHLAWSEQTLDGESNRLIPQDVYETFLAHALIYGDSADWLMRHLDQPWQPRGDLHYLGKLIETARAATRP